MKPGDDRYGLARQLRAVGIKDQDLSVEVVERRRSQLVTIMLVAMAAMSFTMALVIAGGEQLQEHAPFVRLPGFQVAAPLLMGILALYIVEKERILRRLSEQANERNAQLRTLAEKVLHDPLTGLANRTAFTSEAEEALERTGASGELLGVLFVDLDGFKGVNDTFGHAGGDALLVEVSGRLRGAVRKGDVLARWGGDEFAILLRDLASPEVAFEIADRVNELLTEPVTFGNHRVQVGASVGVSLSSDGIESAATLLRTADLAMYLAKAAGRGCWRQLEPDTLKQR